jgi:hypothetical protein
MSWIRDCLIGMVGGPVQVFTLENWSPLIIHEAGQNTRGRPPESWGLRKTFSGVGQIIFENLSSDLWKSQRDPRYSLEKNVIFAKKKSMPNLTFFWQKWHFLKGPLVGPGIKAFLCLPVGGY